MVWPAVIAAGAAIGGGLLSNRSARKQAAQQAALQREFAQNSIQWRTADAKAAGLHPLYAMGASPTPYSPTTYSDAMGPALASAGQSIARGYEVHQAQKNADRQYNKSLSDSKFMRNMAQNNMILQQQQLKAQINATNVDTQLRISESARARQFANSQQDLTAPGITDEDQPMVTGLVQEVPNEIPSASKENPSHTAGIAPGWRVVNLGPFNAVTPYSEEGWGEDLNLTKMGVIAAATTAYYVHKIPLNKIGAYLRKNIRKIKKSHEYRKKLQQLQKKDAKQIRIENFGLGQPRPRR